MIFSNNLQEGCVCIQQKETYFDAVETTAPTAADVLRFLQRSLNTGPLLSSIIRFANHLPLFSGNIVELHFGKQENSVDFATRLNVTFDKPLIEAAKKRHFRLPFLTNDLTRLINEEENKFNYGLENIWIEYDAPFQNTPAVFFDINRHKVFCPQLVYATLQNITGMFDYSINTELLIFLEQLKEAGLYVVYYGLMFSRATTGIRLTIKGVQPEHLVRTLKNLGWKGNDGALEKLVAAYLTNEQKLLVDVDFDNSLGARIGIEVFDDSKAAFIRTLYGNGQITKTQFDLLNTWEQCVSLTDSLSTVLSALHCRPVNELHTRLNHFKFVVDDTNAVAAKAYLYYCF